MPPPRIIVRRVVRLNAPARPSTPVTESTRFRDLFSCRDRERRFDLAEELLRSGWAQRYDQFSKLRFELLLATSYGLLSFLRHQCAGRLVGRRANIMHVGFGNDHALSCGSINDLTRGHAARESSYECGFVSLSNHRTLRASSGGRFCGSVRATCSSPRDDFSYLFGRLFSSLLRCHE